MNTGLLQSGTALYLHVPFCASSCDFCSFYQEQPKRGDLDRYLAAIERELALQPPGRVETAFWGGGTPGLLPADDLRRLGQAMTRAAGQPTEWTVELAPSSVRADKLAALKELGVTRVSMGVQSFDEATLDALTSFGDHLGMCFQIVDDILDLTADTDTLGKPAGNDLMEGVYTLPVIAALEHSPELRARLGGEVAPDEVDGIRAMVRAAGGVDVAREVAIAEATKANEVLRSASALDPAVTGGMIRLVEGLIDRTS